MKKILVTQRVYENSSYPERRDAIDQSWASFFMALDAIPIFLPNHIKLAQQIIDSIEHEAILLTGGNSLVSQGGDAPERDELERFLVTYAVTSKLKLIGVCRGMQVIQDYFNEDFYQVSGHVNQRHKIRVSSESRYSQILKNYRDVNAFHSQGCLEVKSEELLCSAIANDGVVMAIEHIELPIWGQMWHPEREDPFHKSDLDLFNQILNKGHV